MAAELLGINETADLFLNCVNDALNSAGYPVCAHYRTVGPPVIGPLCCECAEDPDVVLPPDSLVPSGEATIHFEQLYDADPTTLDPVDPVHPCKRVATVADFTIVVTHCYPVLDGRGEIPHPDDLDAAADTAHKMMETIWLSLTCGTCIADMRFLIRAVAVDAMPEGGCSVIVARLSAEVKIKQPV